VPIAELDIQADDAKAKEMGVPIIAIDYNNVEAMKDTLESNNIGTIVASLETTTAPGPELSLVKAADASTVTKRFIPTTYGIKYTLAYVTCMLQTSTLNIHPLTCMKELSKPMTPPKAGSTSSRL
jgi:hypothetical protein